MKKKKSKSKIPIKHAPKIENKSEFRKSDSMQDILDRITEMYSEMDKENLYKYVENVWKNGVRDLIVIEKILTLSIDDKLVDQAEEILDYYDKNFPHDARFYLCKARVAHLKYDHENVIKYGEIGLQQDNIPPVYQSLLYNVLAHTYRVIGNAEKSSEMDLKSATTFDPDEETDSHLKKFLSRNRRENYSNYLFSEHSFEMTREEMFRKIVDCRKYFEDIEPMKHLPTDELRRAYESGRKLRIGYASPDFRFHVVAFFAYCMLKSYDAKRFEIFCYSNCPENPASREFAESVINWRNVTDMNVKQVVDVMLADKLDILFDFSGHTANNFLAMMQYKPAPVQISGIGWFDTTGLDTIDYFLADYYTDPPGYNDEFFTEKLLRMKYSHFCYMWHDKPQPVLPAPFLKNGYITFGSFNQFSKVRPDVFKAWKKIMDLVPNSKLMLKCEAFDSEFGQNLAREKLASYGFDLNRIDLSKHEAAYLEKYQQMDIALDTFPYPGGGTTCDAIYMGVPVITLIGERHNSRFGYSLLMNMDLPELCAESWDDYIQKAVDLANDSDRLQMYHQTLRRRMIQSPLMNDIQYMGELETKYEQIYFDWLYPTDEDKARAVENIDRNLEPLIDIIEKNIDRLAEIPDKRDEFIRLSIRRMSLPNPPIKLLLLISKAYLSIKTQLPEGLKYIPGDTLKGRVYYKRIVYHLAQLTQIDSKSRTHRRQGNVPQLNSEVKDGLEKFSLNEWAQIYLDFAVALSRTDLRAESYAAIQNCHDFILRAELNGELFSEKFLWRYSYVFAEICVKNGYAYEAVERYQNAADLTDDVEKKIALLQNSLLVIECLNLSSNELSRYHTRFNGLFDNIRQFSEQNMILRVNSTKHRKARIGYLSQNFKENITFNYIYGIFVTCSHDEFENYAYSLLPKNREDLFTDEIRKVTDKFIYAAEMSSSEIAQRIYDDEIDILVDLTGNEVSRPESGLSGVSSLSILARKPAPIQISNFISTTGLEVVDYFLTDEIVDPPMQHDDLFAEQLLYFPCHMCYAGRDDLEPISIPPFKKNGYVTFGSFHRYIKITDEILLAWKEIIERVPNSRLVLKSPEFVSPSVQDVAYERLQNLGFDMNHVAVEDPSPDYMPRYSELDISLDTYPYSGMGVACDALYMGVPVVTICGERRSSRFAASILCAVGLDELVTDNMQDYIERAVGLALDSELLEILHKNLRQMFTDTNSLKSVVYNRNLEKFYRDVLNDLKGDWME